MKPEELGESVCIKYNDGLWKPVVVIDKNDTRSYTVQTTSGGSNRRNRRHLLKAGEKSDINHNPNILSSDNPSAFSE